jgi:hypothetical protein
MARPIKTQLKTGKWPWIIGATLILGLGGAAWLIQTSGWFHPLGLPVDSVISGKISAVTPAPYRIGDLIPVRLEIKARDGVTFKLPDLAANGLAKLELKAKTVPRIIRYRGGFGQISDYTLTSWETGQFTIPALQGKYQTKQGKTARYTIPACKITVVSVLPKGRTKTQLLALKPKGAKPPVALPPNYQSLWYLVAIGGGLAFVRLIIYLVRKLRRNPHEAETVTPVIQEPAHEVALRRLQDLKGRNYLEDGNFKAYYTELSECLRQYMENRFQVNALEMTTEEFLSFLTGNQLLPVSCRKNLKKFLIASDLIKFAKHLPEQSEASEAWKQVYEIVETTKPVETVETDQTTTEAQCLNNSG